MSEAGPCPLRSSQPRTPNRDSPLQTHMSCTLEDGDGTREKGCVPMGTAGRGVEVTRDRPHQGRVPRGGSIWVGSEDVENEE